MMEFKGFGLGNAANLVKRDMMMMTWERVGSWHQSDEQDKIFSVWKGMC